MESLFQILRAISRGLIDSLSGTVVLLTLDKNIQKRAQDFEVKGTDSVASRRRHFEGLQSRSPKSGDSEGKVLKRTLQCCALNGGVFWFSILVFEYGLLPFAKYVLILLLGNSSIGKSAWSLIHTSLSFIFSVVWVVPIFVLSKVVNSLWFQDIADSAFRYSRGRPQLLWGISSQFADALFSVLVQFLFLIQSLLVTVFPLPPFGYILSLVHMCMLYSLYAFEYKWYNLGWVLHRRLCFIEENWPYFIGFGLPLAVLTGMTSSYIISGCVFSILFPLFIISANEADPVTNVCDTKFQLFSLVIAISNKIFSYTFPSKKSVSR